MPEAEYPWPTDSIEPPEPCKLCGSLEFWWSIVGTIRCLRCEPPSDTALRWWKSSEAIKKFEAIRKRHESPLE